MAYKIPQLAPTLRNAPWVFDPAQGTIVTEFQAGHGYTTSGADASSNVNDTSTFVTGSQCATVVSGGAGASAILLHTGLAPVDTTHLQPVVILKCEDTIHLTSLDFSIANDSGFSNEYHISFGSQVQLASGAWIAVSLSLANGQSQGSPTRTGITAVRCYFKDDNTGNKVTIHWQGIYWMPDCTTQAGTPYPAGAASICFDDGFQSAWNVAKPYLDSYGYRASAYLIKDRIGTSGRLTLAQAQAMQDQSGWEINSHAYTDNNHGTTDPGLTPAQLLWDLATEKEWLGNNGLTGQGFAYPKGAANPACVTAVRRFYKYARGTQGLTETWPPADPYRLKSFSGIGEYSGGTTPVSIHGTGGQIDQAVANGAWLILTFHNVIPPVTSVTMTGNIATIVFGGVLPTVTNWTAGNAITLAGFTPSGLNGNYTIASVVDQSTITVNIGSNPGNGTVMGTATTATTDCSYGGFTAIIDKLRSSGIRVLPTAEVFTGQGVNQAFLPTTALSSTVPAGPSTTAATGGILTAVSRTDHAHPMYQFQPSDHGLINWAFDPVTAVSNVTPLATAGLLYLVKTHFPVAANVTNIVTFLTAAGATLTTGQCFAAMFQSGALIGVTGDQSTAWASTGAKVMPITGGPLAVSAGDVYVGYWFNGTTGPALLRGNSSSAININLAIPSARFATANTGLTTTAPGTLGALTAFTTAYFAAHS